MCSIQKAWIKVIDICMLGRSIIDGGGHCCVEEAKNKIIDVNRIHDRVIAIKLTICEDIKVVIKLSAQ